MEVWNSNDEKLHKLTIWVFPLVNIPKTSWFVVFVFLETPATFVPTWTRIIKPNIKSAWYSYTILNFHLNEKAQQWP